MRINILEIANKKALVILVSAISAYSFWSIIHRSLVACMDVRLPVYAYALDGNKATISPQNITISLVGNRTILNSLDKNRLALFINAQEMRPGKNSILITEKHLLLPAGIKIKNKDKKIVTIDLERA